MTRFGFAAAMCDVPWADVAGWRGGFAHEILNAGKLAIVPGKPEDSPMIHASFRAPVRRIKISAWRALNGWATASCRRCGIGLRPARRK